MRFFELRQFLGTCGLLPKMYKRAKSISKILQKRMFEIERTRSILYDLTIKSLTITYSQIKGFCT